MQAFTAFSAALGRDRRGASGLEYALLAGMVAVVLVSFVVGMQHSMSDLFGNVNRLLANA